MVCLLTLPIRSVHRSERQNFSYLKIAVDPPLAARIQVGMKKRYIGYFRVSTRQQGLDGNGMTSQREIVRLFVDGQKGVLDQEFSEVETGKKTSERRPQLAAALDRCKRTKATLVIAKLDRLARNAEFLLRLQNSGVDFVCCDCPNADKFTVGNRVEWNKGYGLYLIAGDAGMSPVTVSTGTGVPASVP